MPLGFDEEENECPICGGKIWGRGHKILIEGAKVVVCDGCAQHGEKVAEKRVLVQQPYKKKAPTKKTKSPSHFKSSGENLDDLEIVSDYSEKIRKARQSRGLNQEKFAQNINEKPSLIRRIETGKAKPTLQLAKKIEKAYEVELLKRKEIMGDNMDLKKFLKKTDGSSLGDIAFIKKKKK